MSSTDASTKAKSVLASYRTEPDNLLPVLHAIQDAVGFIPQDLVADIAQAFNLSRAEVHGVISFYHYFRFAPPARHVVQICRAESCQSMGGEALLAHAKQSLGCGLHEKDKDGKFSLEPVYCLGLCATSPSALIDGEPLGRLDADKISEALEEACAP